MSATAVGPGGAPIVGVIVESMVRLIESLTWYLIGVATVPEKVAAGLNSTAPVVVLTE